MIKKIVENWEANKHLIASELAWQCYWRLHPMDVEGRILSRQNIGFKGIQVEINIESLEKYLSIRALRIMNNKKLVGKRKRD